MNVKSYRAWRPKYSNYEKNYPKETLTSLPGKSLLQFLALSGLSCEASEAQAVIHKDLRNARPYRLDKVKDELSDVWWYFNMCLDVFDLTLEELSDYNKKKLDARNAEV